MFSEQIKEDPDLLQFWVAPQDAEKSEPRIRATQDRLLVAYPVLRSVAQRDPVLQDMLIIRLFPVRALSTVFRAKYLAALQRAFDAGQLTFAEGTADLADRRAFVGFLGPLRATAWIVYAKRPFAGPAAVLGYLGRYTHRVALSNDRLIDHRDGHVRFRWKDYADHDRVKVIALETDEFLRRFLLHVVPRGFMRIRHFGLLANRARRDALTRCRDLLGHPPSEDAQPESAATLLFRLTGIDLARCPVCGEGRMQITAILGPVIAPPDTS